MEVYHQTNSKEVFPSGCRSEGKNASLAEERYAMSTIEEIEQAVEGLAPDQLAVFRAWFAEFDAANWDQKIESDDAAGRLDALAEEALDDSRHGRFTDL